MADIHKTHNYKENILKSQDNMIQKGVRLYSLLLKKSGLKNMVKLHWCMVDALVSEADERRDKLR